MDTLKSRTLDSACPITNCPPRMGMSGAKSSFETRHVAAQPLPLWTLSFVSQIVPVATVSTT